MIIIIALVGQAAELWAERSLELWYLGPPFWPDQPQQLLLTETPKEQLRECGFQGPLSEYEIAD